MHPKDWPWSSWSYYTKEEQGLPRIDPLGERRGPASGSQVVRKVKNRTLKTEGCGTQKSSLWLLSAPPAKRAESIHRHAAGPHVGDLQAFVE